MACKLNMFALAICLVQATAGAADATQSCNYSIGEKVKILVGAIRTNHKLFEYVPIPFGTEGTIRQHQKCDLFLVEFVDRPAGVTASTHITKPSRYSKKHAKIRESLAQAGYPLHSRVKSLTTQPKWNPRALHAGELGTVAGLGESGQDLFVLFDGGIGKMPLGGSVQFDEVCRPEKCETDLVKAPQVRYNVSLASKGLMIGDTIFFLGQYDQIKNITLADAKLQKKSLATGTTGVIVPMKNRESTDRITVQFANWEAEVELGDEATYCIAKEVVNAARSELQAQVHIVNDLKKQLTDYEMTKSRHAEVLEEQRAEQLKWMDVKEMDQKAIDSLSSENNFLMWLVAILASSHAVIAMIACMPKWKSHKNYRRAKRLAGIMMKFYRPAFEQLLINNMHSCTRSPLLDIEADDTQVTSVPAKKFLHVEAHFAVPSSNLSSSDSSHDSELPSADSSQGSADRTRLPIEPGLSKLTLQREKGSNDEGPVEDEEPVGELLRAAVTIAANRVLGNLTVQPAFLSDIAIVPTTDVPVIEAAVNWVWEADEFMEMDRVKKIAVKKMTESGWEKGNTMRRI